MAGSLPLPGSARGVIYTLAERTGRIVDITYSSLVHQLGLTPPFFKEGLGELDVVDFHKDLVALRNWLPHALDEPVGSCAEGGGRFGGIPGKGACAVLWIPDRSQWRRVPARRRGNTPGASPCIPWGPA